ncbi:hypothetical protein THF1C08_100103 [Vibrio jasicida]|uniref:Uncharacterized protein n=1 Tax=Vibrio jasicida TaxID=766224 RepID=A0AAU9QXW9_9VIBR|nr:hypothetical protein THF1C08_100103 [Vibrio jasicida]CAH1603998.1 hypothetical protein THF1A12_90102 [Vibrio jasicida]
MINKILQEIIYSSIPMRSPDFSLVDSLTQKAIQCTVNQGSIDLHITLTQNHSFRLSRTGKTFTINRLINNEVDSLIIDINQNDLSHLYNALNRSITM